MEIFSKVVLKLSLLFLSFYTVAEECGDVFDQYIPPKDYSTASKAGLAVVERRHFTRNVEMLISGESGTIIGDLNYTLNKYPNHYRALLSLINYDIKTDGKLSSKNGFPGSVSCYFARAIQFRPRDSKVRQIYGIYMYKNGRYKEALKKFQTAEKIDNSAEIEYNIALTYIALNELDNAKIYANRAYSNGYPLQGLRTKLLQRGIVLD
ncbi:tetratricopeptide repeat protein [Thalassotalea montiporae]